MKYGIHVNSGAAVTDPAMASTYDIAADLAYPWI